MKFDEIIEKFKDRKFKRRVQKELDENFEVDDVVWLIFYSPNQFIIGTIIKKEKMSTRVNYLIKINFDYKTRHSKLKFQFDEQGHKVLTGGNCEWFGASLLSKKLKLPGLILLNELKYE